MKWLCQIIIFNIIFIEITFENQMDNDPEQHKIGQINEPNEIYTQQDYYKNRSDRQNSKQDLYTTWGHWSDCQNGRKTRRRHCLQRRICGDALRIEIKSCKDFHRPPQINNAMQTKTEFVIPQLRQLISEDVQKRFRGFSQWSSWSTCSRRCITVRRSHCLRRAICGHQVVRQSAYCYIEGSYCHLWIRSKMQRRKDPGDLAHRIHNS